MDVILFDVCLWFHVPLNNTNILLKIVLRECLSTRYYAQRYQRREMPNKNETSYLFTNHRVDGRSLFADVQSA